MPCLHVYYFLQYGLFYVNFEFGDGCEIKYADLGRRIFKHLENDEEFKELTWKADNGCDGLTIAGNLDSYMALKKLNDQVESERSKIRLRYFVTQPLDVDYKIKVKKLQNTPPKTETALDTSGLVDDSNQEAETLEQPETGNNAGIETTPLQPD